MPSGGKNTTKNGKKFEENTNIEAIAICNGFKTLKTKKINLLYRKDKDKTIFILSQHNFKIFMKVKYNLDAFRCPDEAFVIEKGKERIIKILEKKYQTSYGQDHR